MNIRTDATKAGFFRCRRLVQQRLREMPDTWMVRHAISDAANDQLPQLDMNNDLDLPPSLPETVQAVQPIFIDKTLVSDAIPLEVYKHGRPRLVAELTTVFQ
ncbi:unnamed protein product [Schistocephalus solidus]|uniref:Transposase n=1 Tax=Schistocephalus solidus TaxID=70667 RepID=A0A183TM03_SCHSO|nr:unnamed protein product [Schistocephalus solidus]